MRRVSDSTYPTGEVLRPLVRQYRLNADCVPKSKMSGRDTHMYAAGEAIYHLHTVWLHDAVTTATLTRRHHSTTMCASPWLLLASQRYYRRMMSQANCERTVSAEAGGKAYTRAELLSKEHAPTNAACYRVDAIRRAWGRDRREREALRQTARRFLWLRTWVSDTSLLAMV